MPQHTLLQGEAGQNANEKTLTINVDSGPAFTTNVPGSTFTAPPGQNVLGPSNTLNAGDNFGSTVGDATLNVTEVASLLGNPALAAGVTMFGVSTANILNTSAGVAGFSGVITGLTTANMQGGTNGNVLLGLASAGLNTLLQNLGVGAASNITTWIAAAALAGATDSININLHGFDASADVLVTGGGNNGYETAIINSADGANIFDFDVNYTSLATIRVTGGSNLTMPAGSTALNLANLALFDGTLATGDLTISFPGAGDVVAQGGSGNDSFTFPAGNGAGAVEVHGNAGDDVFTFLTNNGAATTFTANDIADGGAGTNRLILQADNGQLLQGGVIQNIGTVQHNSIGATNGTILADMSQSGSATVLQLNGNYGGNDVNVSNLVTAKSVLYTGNNIDDFTLDATSLLGQINLTMNKTVAGGTQIINDLHVTVGNLLNLTSLGDTTTTNQINDVSDVNANVSISGAHQLNFGFNPASANATNAGNAYDFAGGIIDATAMTGPLSIGLAEGSQTLALGTGNDLVHEWTSINGQPDIINMGPLATGGNDNVVFHDTFTNGGLAISGVAPNYTQLQGFNVANDIFTIDASFAAAAFQITLQETNATGVFNPPAVFNYNIGTALVNLAGSFTDMIKVDSAVGGGLTAQGLFNASMQATGSIIVAGAANDILFGAYNNDTQQAVIMVVHPDTAGPANIINSGDDVDVVAQIGMTFTDYQTFGNNGSLVFV